MNRKFLKFILVFILILILGGLIGWYILVISQPIARVNTIDTRETQPVEYKWNVYRNEEFGFTFDYPPDWQLQISPDEWGINPFGSPPQKVVTVMPQQKDGGDGYAFTIAVANNTSYPYLTNPNFRGLIPIQDIKGRKYFIADELSNITVDGIVGREFTTRVPIGISSERRIYLVRNQFIYSIIGGIYFNEFEEEYEKEQKVFTEILGTFKFLDLPAQKIQPEEQAVLETYKLYEKAMRTGDGKLVWNLYSEAVFETATESYVKSLKESLLNGIPARPDIRLEYSDVVIQKNKAAVIGKMIDENETQFYGMQLVLENEKWKIFGQSLRDEPFKPYVYLPSEDGVFTHAGYPWGQIPYTQPNNALFSDDDINWKIQATYDNDILHVRFTSHEPLPAVYTEVEEQNKTGAPEDASLLVVEVSQGEEEVTEYSIDIGDVTTTRTEFDEDTGQAVQSRHFVNYSFSFTDRTDKSESFYSFANDFDELITVTGNFIDVKVPLQSLRIIDDEKFGIVIRNFNSRNKFFPYTVINFVEEEST